MNPVLNGVQSFYHQMFGAWASANGIKPTPDKVIVVLAPELGPSEDEHWDMCWGANNAYNRYAMRSASIMADNGADIVIYRWDGKTFHEETEASWGVAAEA